MTSISLPITYSLNLENRSNLWISHIFSEEYKFKAGQYLLYQGDIPNKIYIVLEGWANNHKLFDDGRKQVVNFVLPGNLIGLQFDETEKIPYMVEAVTDMRVLGINQSFFWERINADPLLMLKILSEKEKDLKVLEKRIILLTASNSFGSMAQMLALLYIRLVSVGVPSEEARFLPLNQIYISEVLGISYIHAHRIFKKLEKMKLVAQRNQCIELSDIDELLKISYEKWEKVKVLNTLTI